jgi:hypothetical protein
VTDGEMKIKREGARKIPSLKSQHEQLLLEQPMEMLGSSHQLAVMAHRVYHSKRDELEQRRSEAEC